MIASKRLQYATNVSTGISTMISGTDSSAPNNGVLRSVNGLAFANNSVRSFTATVTVSITRSSGGNLFETFTLEGNQRDASWDLVVSGVGDNTSTTFSITSAGQVQHTTATVSNWTSTTIRFSAIQINVNGSLTGLSTTTTGSYIVSSLQLSDTTDAVSGVSNGGLHVLGGATVTKNINAGSISTANINASNIVATNVSGTTAITTSNIVATNVSIGSLTAGNLTVPGTLTVTNISVNNLVQSSGSITITGNSNTIGNIFTTGGNVGIGTTSPSSIKLHILESSANNINPGSIFIDKNNARSSFQTWNYNNNKSNLLIGSNIYWDNAGTSIIYNTSGSSWSILMGNNSDSFSIFRNSSNIFTTISSGNVGINVGNPGSLLEVSGSLRIINNTNPPTSGRGFEIQYSASAGISNIYSYDRSNNVYLSLNLNDKLYIIGSTGNATLTGSLTQNVSDIRLKTNVQSISNALDKICELNGILYNYNQTAKDLGINEIGSQVGLIAQEVEQVLPEVVKLAPCDAEPDGTTSRSGLNYRTIQYERMIPLLVEAIKELRQELKAHLNT